jgi:hypothetical protein
VSPITRRLPAGPLNRTELIRSLAKATDGRPLSPIQQRFHTAAYLAFTTRTQNVCLFITSPAASVCWTFPFVLEQETHLLCRSRVPVPSVNKFRLSNHLISNSHHHYGSSYCSVWYRCYATITRRNMRCLVTDGKHVNNIRANARQPPITITEKGLEAVFSVGSAPRLYSEDPRPAERLKLGGGQAYDRSSD